jgi:sugar phosphate isomerase/epimerase
MRVGVFTPLLSQLRCRGSQETQAALHIDTVELGTGNYPGDAHCKLSMLEDISALAEFQKVLADHGATISALSCHGNALHPDQARAQHDREVSRKTILLAEKLGIQVVVDFSGCPGDSPNATAPNWVTCPWPPDYLKVLDWQWNEGVAPYWIEHAKFAADHGVKIAIEMHPGIRGLQSGNDAAAALNCRPQRGLQLRSQPSLLAEHRPDRRVRVLKDAIFHVHAKDTQLYPANLPTHRRARHQALHRRARARLDLPHLRLRSRRGVVERVYLDAAHVWLRFTCSRSSMKTACSRRKRV